MHKSRWSDDEVAEGLLDGWCDVCQIFRGCQGVIPGKDWCCASTNKECHERYRKFLDIIYPVKKPTIMLKLKEIVNENGFIEYSVVGEYKGYV